MTSRSPSVRYHEEPDNLRDETCPDCGGSGMEETTPWKVQECSACDGTGRVDPERLAEDRAEAAADDRWEARNGN